MRERSLMSVCGLLVALLSVSLMGSGCTTLAPATQRVDVPVYVSCLQQKPVRPVFEFDTLPTDASDGRKVMALARDWARSRKYEGELEAAMVGCQESGTAFRERPIER